MSVVATFTSAFGAPARAHYAPLPVGAMARTESIASGASGALTAAAGEDTVELTADADGYAAIGADPDPTAASDGTRAAHFLKADTLRSFSVSPGDKVAWSES